MTDNKKPMSSLDLYEFSARVIEQVIATVEGAGKDSVSTAELRTYIAAIRNKIVETQIDQMFDTNKPLF